MKRKLSVYLIILISIIFIFTSCDILEYSSLDEEGNNGEVKYREGEFVVEIIGDPPSTNSINTLASKDTYLKLVEYKDKTRYEVKEIMIEQGYNVKSIFPNIEFKVMKESYNTVLFEQDLSWNLEMVNLHEAYNHFEEELNDQSSVKIAVLDTGLDPNHESLRDFIVNDLAANFTRDGLDDVYGHGTHVAGIIAAHTHLTGVMQEAKLVNVKVLNDSGGGTFYDILDGIEYAIDINADVINMSLGGYISNREEDAIRLYNDLLRYALDQGSLVVAAAGNSRRPVVISRSGLYPAASPYSLAVGASNIEKRLANYSNYGNGLHIVAPGTNIYSSIPGDQYEYFSGTSMSAPHIAGLAGLIRALDSEISAEDKFNLIKSSGNDNILSDDYRNVDIGSGHMDVYRTINRYYLRDYLPD